MWQLGDTESGHEGHARERPLIAAARVQAAQVEQRDTESISSQADPTTPGRPPMPDSGLGFTPGIHVADPPPDELPVGRFPGYDVLREIHRGGQGVVYLAVQTATRRKVAIKVMHGGALAGPRDRARFEREVQILGALKHPNVVTIHESRQAPGGLFYYVMDYIAGEPFDRRIAECGLRIANCDAGPQRRSAVRETVRLFVTICDAVNAAHRRGIVHRDLKPSNIRVDSDGEPHVLDFGLAKAPLGEPTDIDAQTTSGDFVGSLPWASPEQADGRADRVDARTDVYALGMMLYRAVTGRFPYLVCGNVRDVLNHIVHTEPARPRTLLAGLDNDLDTVLVKCLQKRPERRYQNAGELGRDLAHYLAGEPIDAKRDRLGYVLGNRLRAALLRQRRVAYVTIALLAALIGRYVGVPLVYAWTPLSRVSEKLLTSTLGASGPDIAWRDVRCVLLTDDVPIETLAANAGLADVTTADRKSQRRLHGRLMQRLAASGARAVVWDFTFPNEHPFDADFLAGVRALRDASVDTVVGVRSWEGTDASVPVLSPAIQQEVRWGSVAAQFSKSRPWRVLLAQQRGWVEPRPGLCAAALAAIGRPGAHVSLGWQPPATALTLHYWRAAPGVQAPRSTNGPIIVLQASAHMVQPHDDLEEDLRQGDDVAYFLVDVPPDEALRSRVFGYAQVLQADAAELRQWFAGRTVVIGDGRSNATDQFDDPYGRKLPGCFGHAAGIQGLLTTLASDLPRVPLVAVLIGAAGLGVLAWCASGKRRELRWALPGALTLGLILASVVLAWSWRYLADPLVPALTLLTACGLTALFQRGLLRVQER